MDGKNKNKTNVLIALVGESGAGKSVIAKFLEDFYGMKYIRSYTTRKKRVDHIDDHIYVNMVQYNKIVDKVAENYYDGNWYCATRIQCDEASVYVVDVPGLKILKENYHSKPVLAFYIKTPIQSRIKHMEWRGDNSKNIRQRILRDKSEFEEVLKYCDYVIENEGDYGGDIDLACEEIVKKIKEFEDSNKRSGNANN